MKQLKPKFHLYIEANQHKQNTEQRYFNELNREFEAISIDPSLSLNELAQLSKKSQKKKHKAYYKQDHFAAIIDGDVDYNRHEQSINARVKEIQKITKLSNVSVYMSNRCWENWIVLHYQQFSRFTDHQTEFPIPNYEKTKSWYRANIKYLLENKEQAIKRSEKLRTDQLKNFPHLDLQKDMLPDLRHPHEIVNLLKVNPITYVDILLIKMLKLEKQLMR